MNLVEIIKKEERKKLKKQFKKLFKVEDKKNG